MAVSNTLAKKRTEAFQNVQSASYEVGKTKIELTPEIVRQYMVSGDKDSVTVDEVIMFMNLCKNSGLNPWTKEAYCIKYGNKPATMVIGKEAYMKRAEANEHYDGFEAGIIVLDAETREVIHRTGCFKLPSEEVLGGWAKVYRKDRSHAYEAEVSFDEYAGKKNDGSLNSQWSKKPSTMIRKVALVQALREAFPSAFSGMYAAEEKGFAEDAAGEVYVPPVEAVAIEEKVVTQPVANNSTATKESVPTQNDAQETVQEGQQMFF